jgi:hypothetical protein
MKIRTVYNRASWAFRKRTGIPVLSVLLFFSGLNVQAIENGNPLVTNIFTADASAHEYEGRVYVYGSHDKDGASGYNMTDYHVLSSSNLVDWVDHGVALDVADVPWASSKMWAPDCAYKDGTYYFYFPARSSADNTFRVGVATSSSPSGPFVAEESYIEGTDEIDPAVFVDDDGQAYLYWGGHTLNVAKLDGTMLQIEGEIVQPEVDYYYEGPWMHKKDGIYYLSYSEGGNSPGATGHLIAYCTSTNAMGPFTYQGILNDDVPGITNHGSTLKRKGQWYYFYHNTKISGEDHQRNIVADYLHYNDDGSIRTVIQTDLGLGQYNGLAKIEAENYTETSTAEQRESDDGGLHVVFDPNDEILFTNVDMDDEVGTNVLLKVASASGTGSLEIRTTGDQLLGSISIPDTGGTEVWITLTNDTVQLSGRNDISLSYVNTETNQMRLDWIDFWGQEEEEVEVEVPVDDRVNLALTGTAIQSSTNYSGISSLAIDGNTNGAWSGGSVTHTAEEPQPWWELDLGDPYGLDEIVVWGRTDSPYNARLSDYDVTLLDSDSNAVWSSYQADFPNPSVTLNPNGATGQYVRVQLRGTNALSLAEVQVFETPVATVVPVGLVAEWPLDDGGGTVVSDVSGNGFDGTLSGGVWVNGTDGGALEFNGSDTVAITNEVFGSINNEISIAFWAYGDPDLQPLNCTVFSAVDADGIRLLNIHLPWASKVYWDAGNSDGYDRISKSASVNEYEGRWNHWVFTKDAVAGTMNIYLNGTLWHSGSGNNKPMSGIVANARFGSGVNADYYDGSLDDFRIYNVVLTADEISVLYRTSVYSGWASGYGLTGDDALADADMENGGIGDGYNNLAEYALGMNPTNADAGSRNWADLAVEDGTNWFDYIYYRRINCTNEGLGYLLIDSTNLVFSVSYTNRQEQIHVGNVVDGYEPVTNCYRINDPAMFIQLGIQQD